MFTARNLKAALVAGLAALPLLLVVSCGTDVGERAGEESSVLDWKSQPRTERFTAQEIASVYTTATKVVNGKTYPDSKPPLKFLYSYANAPQKFKDENGVFNSGAEIKGFLNLGFLPTVSFQRFFVGNFEKVTTWKTIKTPKGDELFSDAYTTDQRGSQIADWSDGYAAEAGEIHYANLALKTNTPIGSLSVPSSITIYNRGGEMQVDVTNAKDVKAPFVGTVIKSGGLRIHLKAFPYQRGWLVYGTATVKLEKFQDALKPEDLSNYVDALFTWIKDRTVVAIR